MVAFGLALPVLLIGSAAAVEYSSLAARRSQLQKAADTAALAAAQELKIATADDGRVASVARTVATSALREGADPQTTATIVADVVEQRTAVQVLINETVSSLLGKAMSLPSTEIQVKAIARLSGNATKICVVALEPRDGDTIRLDSNAKLTANGCAIYSNSVSSRGVRSESNAVVASTQLICSAGGFVGGSANYQGRRLTDCPATPDPLAGRQPPPIDAMCRYTNKRIDTDGTYILEPGTYCGGLHIGANAKVTLSPGVYVMKDGQLRLDSNADVYGRNVGFYFTGKNAYFQFLSNVRVNLGAPRDGPMAGVLFWGDPNAEQTRRYIITSNYANTLIGTIYVPKGEFVVDSSQPVADQSAWTAVIVSRLQLFQQPHLVLNSNYNQTDVPVPNGLVPSGQVRLAQ